MGTGLGTRLAKMAGPSYGESVFDVLTKIKRQARLLSRLGETVPTAPKIPTFTHLPYIKIVENQFAQPQRVEIESRLRDWETRGQLFDEYTALEKLVEGMRQPQYANLMLSNYESEQGIDNVKSLPNSISMD